MYLNGFKKVTICVQHEYNHIQYHIWKYNTGGVDWISVANTLKFYRPVRHLNVFGWTALMSYLCFIRRSNDTLHPRIELKMILMFFFFTYTHSHTHKNGHSESIFRFGTNILCNIIICAIVPRSIGKQTGVERMTIVIGFNGQRFVCICIRCWLWNVTHVLVTPVFQSFSLKPVRSMLLLAFWARMIR